MDAAYGEEIRRTLDRRTVLADYAAGKSEYHFEFLRRRSDGRRILGKHELPLLSESGNRRHHRFFYTLDVTEQKLQEQLLSQIAELDYDIITEIESEKRHLPILSAAACGRKPAARKRGSFQEEIRGICRNGDG